MRTDDVTTKWCITLLGQCQSRADPPTATPTEEPATQTPKATPTTLPVTRFPNICDLPLGEEGAVAWLLIAADLMAITFGAAFTVMARKR